MIRNIALLTIIALSACAQSPLSTPAIILPNAAHTTGGDLQILAPNGVDFGDIQTTANAFTIKGKAANNGNIVLSPGNVLGLASVFIEYPAVSTVGFVVQQNFSPFDSINLTDMTVYALAGNTAGHTVWALTGGASHGALKLSNGTGSGGWDGNGAQAWCTITLCQMQALTLGPPGGSGTAGVLTIQDGSAVTVVLANASGIKVSNSGTVSVLDGSNNGFVESTTQLQGQLSGPIATSKLINSPSTGGALQLYDQTGSQFLAANSTSVTSLVPISSVDAFSDGFTMSRSQIVSAISSGSIITSRLSNSSIIGGSFALYDQTGTQYFGVSSSGMSLTPLSGSGTRCVQVSPGGAFSATAGGCGTSFPTGAWTAFTPTFGFLTGGSCDCEYLQIGKTVFVRMDVSGTTPSGATSWPTVTLPVSAVSNGQTMACRLTAGAPAVSCTATFVTTYTAVDIYNNTAPPSATSIDFQIEGVYESI